MGEPEGKRLLARPRLKQEERNDTKIHLKSCVGDRGMDSAGSGYEIAGSCAQSNTFSVSTKCADYLPSEWNFNFSRRISLERFSQLASQTCRHSVSQSFKQPVSRLIA